ncbi:MAG: FAD-binding protein [Gemmatimonadetes bacterium]|nr:FAD-binding protein [Gemmatimonadota bacterium]
MVWSAAEARLAQPSRRWSTGNASAQRAAVPDLLPPALVQELLELVGEEGLITEPSRLIAYESDALTAYRFPPRAVVLPADTKQAAAVVGALSRRDIPFVPRGAGTGLSGGALATHDAVIIGTSRMDRILVLDPPGRLARVQAGVVNADLTAAARPHRLHFPPDPSSEAACTLGGNVAENSGGPHCLKYGVTSRWVTGLTLVLPDGRVVELGGWGTDHAGFDLVGVVVGSEGCFGLVTEIEVRLLPIPEAVRTLLAIFDDMESAGKAVTDIIGSGLLPCALEIIDNETIRAVEASIFAAGYPIDAGAALVIEFDGSEVGLDTEADQAERCCTAAGAREVRRARDEEERLALWKGRKKAYGALGRLAPDILVQDVTVPRSRLPAVLKRIGEIGREHDLRIANSFHAGDGNLHPEILFDRRDALQVARVERASREIMELCVQAGGTITGEHGVGIDKRDYLPLVCSPVEIELMAAVKAVFDPCGLCNPGKVLPAAPATA